MKELIRKLEDTQTLSYDEWTALIGGRTPEIAEYLFERARNVCQKHYGKNIFIRGLIEFTNYCKCDCRYCGLRRSNHAVTRYRLTEEEILACCREGYPLGFRTFVLQGGEDAFFTDERLCSIIRAIKAEFHDCAVTLSVGERTDESYRAFYAAGADRYLLRHETADPAHYALLHPADQTAENRKRCLRSLRSIGFQTGSGFMVGSPGQTVDHLAQDMLFLHELQPHMVGIGPFIPHHDTPFGNQPAGNTELTLFMLALIRLMLPKTLLPATTALGTVAADGKQRGVLAGANVVMPNLSPAARRKQYTLYDNKRCTGDEAAEGLAELQKEMQQIGYTVAFTRGDSLMK